MQVVSYYPPAMSFGGPPQVMFDLGKELARKHSVTTYTTDVLTLDNWRARVPVRHEELDGIKVERFRRKRFSDRLPTKFLKLWTDGLDKRGTHGSRDFDIVHISEITHPLAVQYSFWASKMHIPYVVSIFGNLSPFPNPLMKALSKAFNYLWGRKILENAAALLVQTPHEGEMCARYTSRDKILPLELPIDLDTFRDFPPPGIFKKKYSIPEDGRVILFLGRLHRNKGIQLLLEASAELLKNDKNNYRLVIAGTDEGYGGYLTQRVKELGIEESVVFTGSIFGRDKLEAYVDADVFVTTPTNYEETSLAALEACAAGTPVIVTERNAIPGLTECEAGFQIHYDKAELRNTLLKVLEDSSLRQKMGNNARKLIEDKYALKVVAARLENIFLDII